MSKADDIFNSSKQYSFAAFKLIEYAKELEAENERLKQIEAEGWKRADELYKENKRINAEVAMLREALAEVAVSKPAYFTEAGKTLYRDEAARKALSQSSSTWLQENNQQVFQPLREACGYVENGTSRAVTVVQDDATNDWIIYSPRYNQPDIRLAHGRSFDEAIRKLNEVNK
jgi:hypothetical protein